MDSLNIKDLLSKYYGHLERSKRSKHTLYNYNLTLGKMYDALSESADLENISEKDFRRCIYDYADSLSNTYANNTINTKLNIIKSFISYLYKREYIPDNFGIKLTRAKGGSNKKDILAPDEFEEVIGVLISAIRENSGYDIYFATRNWFMFQIMIRLGLRKSEVVHLKWVDFDMIGMGVSVVGKGDKLRYLPINRDLKEILNDYKFTLEKIESAGYDVFSDYIFRSEHLNKNTGKKDKPMSPKNIDKIFKKVLATTSSTKDITPHSLRHTFSSYCINSGMSIPVLSNILGHANVATTLNIYTHEISQAERQRQMEKVRF